MNQSDTIMNTLEAAKWAAKFYEGRSHTLRQLSAVAGKVMSQPGTGRDEAIAAWVYRPCEDQVRDAQDQERLLSDVEERCEESVGRIVRELVVPYRSNDSQTKLQFVKSRTEAKSIRIAEVLVGLEASFIVMFGGAMAKVDEVREILKFAKFVYENSPSVHPSVRKELASLIVGVENMWHAIMSTMESFERTIGSPDMIPVKLLVVTNDLGTVKIATFEGDPEQTRVRAAFDSLRLEAGGSLFSETMLHATVPVPKVDIIHPAPTPQPDPSGNAS
jgi:hypothetical protein